MNEARLKVLAQHATLWAKTYVTLVEALMREGVPEDTARAEARHAANLAAFLDDERPEVCPDCGEEGGEITSMGDHERHYLCLNGHEWAADFETDG